MFEDDLPTWLYELLPSLYVASGLGVALFLPGRLSTFSGVLLVCAGLRVFAMRHMHRRDERMRLAARTLARSPSRAGAPATKSSRPRA